MLILPSVSDFDQRSKISAETSRDGLGGLHSLPSPFGEGLGVRPYPFGLKRDGVKEVKEVSASLEVKDDTLAGDTIGRTNVDNF